MGILSCDDGNIEKGDGCSKTCVVEIGWVCTLIPYAVGHMPYYYLYLLDGFGVQILDGFGNPTVLNPIPPIYDDCKEVCGDGLNVGGNECDDGNLLSFDGCDTNCVVEVGYSCSGGSNEKADSCFPMDGPMITDVVNLGNNVVLLTFNDTIIVEDFKSDSIKVSLKGALIAYELTWSVEGVDPTIVTEYIPPDKTKSTQFKITTDITSEVFGDEDIIIEFVKKYDIHNIYNIPNFTNLTVTVIAER